MNESRRDGDVSTMHSKTHRKRGKLSGTKREKEGKNGVEETLFARSRRGSRGSIAKREPSKKKNFRKGEKVKIRRRKRGWEEGELGSSH